MRDKKTNKTEGESNMTNCQASQERYSLSDFIKKNQEVIKAITPKNPKIGKDDEWRNESFWEEDSKEK